MSIDWSKTYKGAMRGSRGKFGSYAEALQHANERQEEIQKANAHFKQLEPTLRKSLLDHMVNHKAIKVLAAIEYLSDQVHVQEGSVNASFNLVKKSVAPGTELTFHHWDKTMGQWIFKSQTGEEIEIYDTPTVQIPGGAAGTQVIPNTGFWGLLTRTSIYETVAKAFAEAEEG